MRSIAELRDVEDPAWPLIQAAISDADHSVDVVPVEPVGGEQTLVSLQVTAASPLGALALHTGGLLVDHGWLRVMGAGHPPLNLTSSLDPSSRNEPSGLLRVAFDVLGGSYAINGGALPGALGEVSYFAPDALAWIPLGMGYGAFVDWTMTDHFTTFNEDLRWPGWQDEVRSLAITEGIGLFPFPFFREGRDLSLVSRRPVPIDELLTLWHDLAEQLS